MSEQAPIDEINEMTIPNLERQARVAALEVAGSQQSTVKPEKAEVSGEFPIGTEVKVFRTQSKEIESGWNITSGRKEVRLPGNLRRYSYTVEKTVDGTPLVKELTQNDILQYNPELGERQEAIVDVEQVEKVGGEGLDAAGIDEPTIEPKGPEAQLAQKISNPEATPALSALEQLIQDQGEGVISEEDITALNRYASSDMDKRSSQKDGDGQGSRDAQERMGYQLQFMSSAAKAIASRYAATYAVVNKD